MSEDLRIRPLRDDEYEEFVMRVTEAYAHDISVLGDTPIEVAQRRAEASMLEVLPQGLDTPKHWINVLEVDGRQVGMLWLAERVMDERRVMFIYDIEIDEGQRGHGYGRAAMRLAEQEALVRGINRMELNVFGGNSVARKLYLSMGYVERAILMGKDLTA